MARTDNRGSRLPKNGRTSAAHVSPARTAALKCLETIRRRDAFAQDVIDRHIDSSRMSAEDRAFATRLVLGTVSMQGTLDALIDRALRAPSDVKPDVRDALRLSTYEIIYLRKSAHAAVDQGVELVKSFCPKAAGLANAVLRKIVGLQPAFPFGDPRTDIEAAARLFGFPLWLMERLEEELGHDEALRFAAVSAEAAPAFIAVNAIKSDGSELLEVLTAAHSEPQSAGAGGIQPPGCYRLGSKRALADGRVTRLSNLGVFSVCDAASQAVASLALPEEKPASFLEIGSGRGNKTLLLQSQAYVRYGSQIETYVTVDLHGFKAKLLTERAERFGVHVTCALTGDATDLDTVLDSRNGREDGTAAPRLFEAVFIDAPCTGLGTLRRHPEIRWRIKPDTSEEYARLGMRLLTSAAAHVAPGGQLTYATCTVSPEENARLAASFLKSDAGRDFTLMPVEGASCFASVLSPGSADAHFAVRMVRKPADAA